MARSHSSAIKLFCFRVIVLLVASITSTAQTYTPTAAKNSATATSTDNCSPQQYIFSWSLADGCLPKPRGGTSKGAAVTLATEPSPQWQALQQPGLSKFERDRRAILAMAGGYRASFEFIETLGYDPNYKLAPPYQSWGTEYVYVAEDRGDFISLQHIMVMVVEQKDGKKSEPMVMKHWRQDWQYQGEKILEYIGNNTWKTRVLDKASVQGTWSQSVYQVDDSPRYASFGTWQHNRSFSAWQSADTARPLPRREHTVRDDYQVLEGFNRHVITATGWVQEEENQKQRLAQKGGVDEAGYVARELGNNRYQLLKNFDWSAGDAYWKKTGPFWASVRKQWALLIDQHPQFMLQQENKGTPLFEAVFELADQFEKGKLKAPDEAIATALNGHLMQLPR